MRKYHFIKVLSLALLFLCSLSCSSDLDFNQANDLKLTPVIEGNLSYFDVPASVFAAYNGPANQWAYDEQEFDVFRDKYFNSYLQRADFHFEISNTINRTFSLSIVLLDADNNALTTMNFNIPAYSGNSNIITRTEVFENARLELLKRARKMRFLVVIGRGTALNSSSVGNLVLRSSGTVYLEI